MDRAITRAKSLVEIDLNALDWAELADSADHGRWLRALDDVERAAKRTRDFLAEIVREDWRRCENCRARLVTGRSDARYCSSRCRVAAHRKLKATPVPLELRKLPRWVRYSTKKVPLQANGDPAKSNDPATWSSYATVVGSIEGVGVGFVLNGDGIGCFDLDHCIVAGELSADAKRFIAEVNYFYAEVSPSGHGVHLWVKAEAQKGYRRTVDGVQVEFYTTGRYITITSNALRLT